MNDSQVARVASDQLARSLTMLEDAVVAFTPEEWRTGALPYLRPAGLALHTVETIEFYTSDKAAPEFSWGHRFGVDWEDSESGRLPDQAEILAYLIEVEATLRAWFRETDILAPETLYTWAGKNKLALVMYLQRHTQHHVAELAIELTRRGLPPPEWR